MVSWRERCLLCSKDQLGLASLEEANANNTIAKDATLTAGERAEQKSYQDMTRITELPGVRKAIKKIQKTGWPE